MEYSEYFKCSECSIQGVRNVSILLPVSILLKMSYKICPILNRYITKSILLYLHGRKRKFYNAYILPYFTKK